MPNLFAELISPERVIFQGEIRSVVLPGVEGDMTVLPGHAPVMTMLWPGVIFATDAEGRGRRAFVTGGFVQITPSTVTVLGERVLPVEELIREQIDAEILYLQTVRDASPESARAQVDVSISRLEEFKASLNF